MATIVTGFNRTGAMIILDPRERLLYPFNLGEYSEVRFGMLYSWTAATGDNITPQSDRAYATTPIGYSYMGFSNFNSGTVQFPIQTSGFDFIGIVGSSQDVNNSPGVTNNSTTLTYPGGQGSAGNFCLGYRTDQGGSSSSSAANVFNTNTIFNVTVAGSTGTLAGSMGMRLSFPTSTGYSFNMFYNNGSTAEVLLANLRTGVAAQMETQTSNYVGYFTTGGAATGYGMSKPNSIYIYNPMLNTRMRIHALLVERYA